jgi:hypothetical protein
VCDKKTRKKSKTDKTDKSIFPFQNSFKKEKAVTLTCVPTPLSTTMQFTMLD